MNLLPRIVFCRIGSACYNPATEPTGSLPERWPSG